MSLHVARRRFDVDDYHRMGEAGILSSEDRVELIDGEILTMTPIGPLQNASVNRANRALVSALGERAIVQVQGSIRLDRYSEPAPDLVLLLPRDDFYASRLPGPEDIILVVEVAQSSLEYDRDVKSGLYAAAGVPEFWLVDLNRRVVIAHGTPREGAYDVIREWHAGDTLTVDRLPECRVSAAVFLPHP